MLLIFYLTCLHPHALTFQLNAHATWMIALQRAGHALYAAGSGWD